MKHRGSFLSGITIAIMLIAGLTLTGCLEKIDEGPPTTAIIHPADGAVVTGNVPIIVTAADEKEVKTLRLFIDGEEVQSVDDNNLRYEWNTTPIADNRNHFISAYAIDDDDNIGPSAITTVSLFTLINDTLPQVVTIQHPLDNQTVSGRVNIAVGVDREINNPIDSVAIFVDGGKVTTDREFPYLYQWDVSGLVNGSVHTIFAIAYDKFGFNITSSVTSVQIMSDVVGNITAPIATIENPLDGQTVSGTVNIVTHVDNIEFNPVDSVLFVVDGTRSFVATEFPYIYPWNTSNLPNNSQHTIFSVVYDQVGFNVSSNFIAVRVSSNVIPDVAAPTVTVVFPNPNAQNIFSVSQLGSIKVVADATDDRGVQRVEFYIDGVLQGTDTDPLYEYDWDLSGYATGIDHTIYVRAYDNAGNVGVAFVGVRLEP